MKSKLKEFTLPEEVRGKFDSFVKKLSSDPYSNPTKKMQIMSDKLECLFPQELLATLKNMGKTGEPGAIIIKNFPIDKEVPRAETVAMRSQQKGLASENAMLGTVALMGYKLESNPKEQEGRPVHNVAPVKSHENTKSSKGRDPFYLHIENPFEKSPPDFLMLVGLEGDKTAKTSLFFVDGFIKKLPNWVVEGMKKPEFEIRSGEGFDKEEKGIFPLIKIDEETGRQRLRTYQKDERITPLTDEAKKVLSYVTESFKDVEKTDDYLAVGLQPGEAIIFNNGWGLDKVTGVMHGREGRISNQNRWLQRGFLHQQTEKDRLNIADGYFQSVSQVIADTDNFSIKNAALFLRKAMLETNSCKEYKEKHPDASDAQVSLYGLKADNNSKQSWLARVTKESVENRSII
ncbi:MAG: TauD/TfdA family dioxygenase [Proteobacteria bacterium]|nr:TauD/TfdA family dioxygenase [Pseudomonadota bacterium]